MKKALKIIRDENISAMNKHGYTFIARLVMYNNGDGYFQSHPLDFDSKVIDVTKDSIVTNNGTFKLISHIEYN